MRDIVIDYFMHVLNDTEVIAVQSYEHLAKYDDILAEFVYWIKNNSFKDHDAIEIEGYTAEWLYKRFAFIPVGAYNFLVDLRENPEEMLKLLDENLPVY